MGRRRGIIQIQNTEGPDECSSDALSELELLYPTAPFCMPEIVESVFQHLSKRDLLNCRLVNLLWNEEACRLLRRLCHVRLYDRNLVKFERLLRWNVKLRLPNPFRYYRISIRKLDDRNLTRILNWNPKAGVTFCSIVVSQTSTNSFYQKRLISLLNNNTQFLETLVLTMYRGIYLGYTPLEEKLPILPNLKKIVIKSKARGTRVPEESISFILNIINAARGLEDLEISCDQEDMLIHLVQRGDFPNLKSFYSNGLTLLHLDCLAHANFPMLSKLHLKYYETTLNQEMVNPTTFCRLLRNFAHNLEELSVSWIGSQDNWNNAIPTCPKLKSLTVYLYEGTLAAISPTCLPVLENFNVIEYIEFQESPPSPHYAVKSFSIEDFSGMYFEDEFDTLINFVDKQFPRLASLSICMVLNDSAVRAIVTALPLLLKLNLRVGQLVTEEAFTGVPLGVDIESYLKAGVDLSDIRVLPALAHLRYLTHLDVSNFPTGPSITNVAIKYGLGTMASLEDLQMNWDNSLSPEVIVENLGHLKCLRLSDWQHVQQPCGPILQLKKLMPQLEIPAFIIEERMMR